MPTKVVLLLALFCGIILAARDEPDPSWDHQTQTYYATNTPVTVTGTFSITPYFSPDHSIEVETQLIENATVSVDIGIPGLDSWSDCYCGEGSYKNCTAEELRKDEEFPIFAALLNAIHSGITVRILTNNYNTECYSNQIDPLTFLALAGAQVKYYTSTTYVHEKYFQIDGKRAAVSSVNFSKTSFMKNREAGVIIEGDDASDILDFMNTVFEFDWDQALDWPTPDYDKSWINYIDDKSTLPVPKPTPYPFNNVYVTGLETITDKMEVTVVTSPDDAWNTISGALNATSESFALYIYQVTASDFCDEVLRFSQQFPNNFKMLVSNTIYDSDDQKAAIVCYTNLYNNGVNIYETELNTYEYSHQKYWILDGTTVWLSTGNWSPTDYPPGGDVFPVYGESGWRNSNRDYTVKISHPDVVSIFQTVLDEDYSYGEQWAPES